MTPTDEQIDALAEDLEIRCLMQADEVIVDAPPEGLGEMMEMSENCYHHHTWPDGDRHFFFWRSDKRGERRLGQVILKGGAPCP